MKMRSDILKTTTTLVATLLTLLAVTAATLLTCVKVPEYCSDGNSLNPETEFCDPTGKTIDKCNGQTFNVVNEFCGFDGERRTIRLKCGGSEYNIQKQMCINGVIDDMLYTVYFETDGGTPSYLPRTIEAPEGLFDTIKPPPPTKDCNKFLGWYDGSNTEYVNGKRITGTTSLTAKWESQHKYTVHYNENDSDNGTAPIDLKSPYCEGSTVKTLDKNTLTKTGYQFKGWKGADGNSYGERLDFIITKDMTFNAQWVPNDKELYRVTVNGGIGGNQYLEGDTVSITAYIPDDSLFDYWEVVNGDGVDFANYKSEMTKFKMPANAVEIVANFKPIPKYQVTIRSEGTGKSADSSYKEGAQVEIYAGAALPDKKFKSWTRISDVNLVDANNERTSFKMPAYDVTVQANFDSIPRYRVYYNGNGNTGGAAPEDNEKYLDGTRVTILGNGALTRVNNNFNGWNTMTNRSGVSYPAGGALIIDGKNVMLYAMWDTITIKDYLVTVNRGQAGKNRYMADSTVTITAHPPVGDSLFDDWIGSSGVKFADSSKLSTTFKMPANDVTVTARFKAIPTYQVAVNSDGNGKSGDGKYKAGETVTIFAGTEPSCKWFDKWTSGGVTLAISNNRSTTFTMPANPVTVTASFADNPTVKVSSAGTGATGGGCYAPGATVTIYAGTPVPGQQFKEWTVSGSGVTFANKYNPTTTFAMPTTSVTVAVAAKFVSTTLTDSRGDKQTYKVVVIGAQVWMGENLNYQPPSGSWCYGDNTSNCNTYGRLYNWNTAMDGAKSSTANPSGVRGICPSGWHLPSNEEWSTLTNFVGSTSGTKLKSKTGWYNNGNGTDDYGFSALPAGNRYNIDFFGSGINGIWWTATEYSSEFAYNRYMSYNDKDLYPFSGSTTNHYTKAFAYSVRCVQD